MSLPGQPRPSYPPELDRRILEMILAGHLYKFIAKELGPSPSYISKIAAYHGIIRRRAGVKRRPV